MTTKVLDQMCRDFEKTRTDSEYWEKSTRVTSVLLASQNEFLDEEDDDDNVVLNLLIWLFQKECVKLLVSKLLPEEETRQSSHPGKASLKKIFL